ncbi:hypothetical protein KAR91_12150 [Candidatus Pacearchaeota archaeon]|nr:hypothetical protein [Candidatus Pacearchaeota archaeon]
MGKNIETKWHFGLDYEESTSQFYHIYPCDDEAENLVDGEAICINVPETESNDVRVAKIFDALNDLAEHNN